ncbi:Pycsar system effector family protein [Streptomyces xanthochromogenes]|uniref:Pycsar system effector family protein n=1 Tax=Streptomyces xanthochromogenes TaxID=67384 RepID=UPI003432D3AE
MTETQTPATHHIAAEQLRDKAQAAAGDRRFRTDWAMGDRAPDASAYAAMATAEQMADISNRLLCIDISIGDAVTRLLDQRAQQQAPAAAVDHTESELQVVRSEIARTDSKASILLAGVALVAGPLTSSADAVLHAPKLSAACGLGAAFLVAMAALLLLDTVLPRLHGAGNANFLHYARCTPDELRIAVGEHADRHGELQALSRIAHAKYQCLARAGLALKSAAVLAAAALALATL